MFLYDELKLRADENNPVKVGLIGAGKFGSMFLSQVPTTAGLEVTVIADVQPQRAIDACRHVGWSDELIAKTKFVDNGDDLFISDGMDVVVEATGNPSTSSWLTSKRTCWQARCWRQRLARRELCIRWPTATSPP
jgi:predicted homoserine dehydrogenase-like protein